MLLSDIAAFDNMFFSGKLDSKFKDENDPEIERLYNSSPSIIESSRSFELERMTAFEVLS